MVMRCTPSSMDKPIVPPGADRAALAVMNYTEMESKVPDEPKSSVDSTLTAIAGQRGYQQRTLGGILVFDAGNRQCNPQLVRMVTRSQGACAYGPFSQLLNEIMPMIYKRFTEKSAEEWRQIYKVHRKTVALLHSSSDVRGRVSNSSNSSLKTVQSGSLMMHDHICHC